jgi:hypothetical protein
MPIGYATCQIFQAGQLSAQVSVVDCLDMGSEFGHGRCGPITFARSWRGIVLFEGGKHLLGIESLVAAGIGDWQFPAATVVNSKTLEDAGP